MCGRPGGGWTATPGQAQRRSERGRVCLCARNDKRPWRLPPSLSLPSSSLLPRRTGRAPPSRCSGGTKAPCRSHRRARPRHTPGGRREEEFFFLPLFFLFCCAPREEGGFSCLEGSPERLPGLMPHSTTFARKRMAADWRERRSGWVAGWVFPAGGH